MQLEGIMKKTLAFLSIFLLAICACSSVAMLVYAITSNPTSLTGLTKVLIPPTLTPVPTVTPIPVQPTQIMPVYLLPTKVPNEVCAVKGMMPSNPSVYAYVVITSDTGVPPTSLCERMVANNENIIIVMVKTYPVSPVSCTFQENGFHISVVDIFNNGYVGNLLCQMMDNSPEFSGP
jgi:hypothetical protein